MDQATSTHQWHQVALYGGVSWFVGNHMLIRYTYILIVVSLTLWWRALNFLIFISGPAKKLFNTGEDALLIVIKRDFFTFLCFLGKPDNGNGSIFFG